MRMDQCVEETGWNQPGLKCHRWDVGGPGELCDPSLCCPLGPGHFTVLPVLCPQHQGMLPGFRPPWLDLHLPPNHSGLGPIWLCPSWWQRKPLHMWTSPACFRERRRRTPPGPLIGPLVGNLPSGGPRPPGKVGSEPLPYPEDAFILLFF